MNDFSTIQSEVLRPDKLDEDGSNLSQTPLIASDTPETEEPLLIAQDDDGIPDFLYEFNGGGTAVDRETLERRRSKDTRDALAEYYNDRMRELSTLRQQAEEVCRRLSPQTDAYRSCVHALDLSSQSKSVFESAWFANNYGQAIVAHEQARTSLMHIFFDKLPDIQVEGRAIWLDRGSIVNCQSPDELRQLIRKIAAAGLNVIYFETINAGYSIYPSRYTEQNPLVNKSWDPLAVAIDEAHRQNLELHAWVWTFAVGNKRHNKILNQPDSFPGPILSRSGMSDAAMRTATGELVLPSQHEYWLSPASSKARSYLITLFSEIVTNYDVDGIQLDYIRYPFQNSRQNMGVEAASRYYSETGLSVGDSEFNRKAWAAWRSFQVSSFVKELSETLKAQDPNLKLSAAVFPIKRHNRMYMIQQDWETWVRNGWIDTINPMSYSRSARSLERLVRYIHNVSDDQTLVYPGLSLIKLNAVELLDSLEIARNNGVMGTTLFAYAQFDPDKQIVLKSGPYKNHKAMPPHREPITASIQLISNTRQLISGMRHAGEPMPKSQNLSDMLVELGTLERNMQSLKLGAGYDSGIVIGSAKDAAQNLETLTEEWMAYLPEDSAVRFQGEIIENMVQRVVRMVNYATFQLTTKGYRASN